MSRKVRNKPASFHQKHTNLNKSTKLEVLVNHCVVITVLLDQTQLRFSNLTIKCNLCKVIVKWKFFCVVDYRRLSTWMKMQQIRTASENVLLSSIFFLHISKQQHFMSVIAPFYFILCLYVVHTGFSCNCHQLYLYLSVVFYIVVKLNSYKQNYCDCFLKSKENTTIANSYLLFKKIIVELDWNKIILMWSDRIVSIQRISDFGTSVGFGFGIRHIPRRCHMMCHLQLNGTPAHSHIQHFIISVINHSIF